MFKLSLAGLSVLLGGLDLVSSAALSSAKHAKDITIHDGLLAADSASSSNKNSSSVVNMVRGYCAAHPSRNSSYTSVSENSVTAGKIFQIDEHAVYRYQRTYRRSSSGRIC
jgi:hypothetical protein